MSQAPSLPSAINAGDSFAATLDTTEHTAAAGWAASLRLIGQGTNKSIAGVAGPDGWSFAATGAATAAWAAGSYTSIVLLTKGADRHSVPGATLTVKPDPASATALDLRSPARIALDALQAAYRNYLATNQLMASYSVGTRSFQFQSLPDLIKAIDSLKREVAAEEAAAASSSGQPLSTRVLARM